MRQSWETSATIVSVPSLHFVAIRGKPASAKMCLSPCLDDAHMCMSVCAHRYAMLMATGEYDFDSKGERRFVGAWVRAVHGLCARGVREGRIMSKNRSIADLSHHTVMPYAERGRMLREVGFASPVVVYVCMHVAQHVGDGQAVVLGASGGRPVVTGSRKVDSNYTNFSFAL